MLELSTLGAVGIHDTRGGQLAVSPKPMALLVYLAVARPRGPQQRDTLLALFYPELNQEHARTAMRQLLHALRAAVGADVVQGDRQTVALAAEWLTCDVHAFEVALAAGDAARVVALYGGAFLPGFFLSGCPEFDHWVDTERSRLERAYAGALEQLALEADAADDAPRAVALWQQLAEVDPYATRVTVRLIAALDVAGNRAGALQVAERHAQRLKDELDAEPSPEVEALARRMREQPAPPVQVSGGSTRDRLARAVAGRYRVDRVAGAGGMALVYRADDMKLGRPVALKVLRPELAAAIGHERFLNEIDIAARLAHPNILPLHDAGQADGLVYYVMPYVEDESLRARLAREGPLDVAEAVRITREVADALGHAHERGIVHRDIKPANILMQANHAVVSDFGVALAIGNAVEDPALLATTGTPAYMSPEQAVGSPNVDARSDLFSLGCVLHEMLTGSPPGPEPAPPGARATEPSEPLPGSVEAALAKALAKSPVDRFVTAQEFAEALRAGQGSAAAQAFPADRRVLPRISFLAIVVLVVIAGAVAVGRWMRTGGDESASVSFHPRTAIAVLPLQNLSAGSPHGYFADALHGELLTQFAKVEALSVRGRASVMGYAGTTKSVKLIAEELEVGTLLEASVQVVGDGLRVNVKLIDATTDEHLWAQGYDRTLDDAFAIQSDVAQQVVAAVGATLGESEQQSLAEAPTANAGAYRLYLQGQAYLRRPGHQRQDFESAQQLFERALALDPDFASAHAGLSYIHGQMWWLRYDRSPERLARQREEAEIALRLAPELSEAHWAMGRAHYVGSRDWQAALDEYRIALQAKPNDGDLWRRIAHVHRRLGNWDEFDAAFEKSVQLDPRNANLFYETGGTTYRLMRRYADAITAYNRALTLAPDLHSAAVNKGLVYLDWKGELDTLRAVLDQLPPESVRRWRAQLLLWERKPDSLLTFLGSAPDTEEYYWQRPTSLYAVWAHELRGNDVAAHAAFDSARVLLDSVLAAVPEDWRVHAARGLALAGLGRRQEALREARWLQESVVYREDALEGRYVAEERARILVQAGEVDAALDEIEELLAGPGLLSVHTLRLDPRWDPIRDDPRFQSLLEKYGN